MKRLLTFVAALALLPSIALGSGYTAVGAAGTGTVTTVGVTTANGVSGTVANPTTTPAITVTLGSITPSSVASTGTVAGSNLSGTNTGDQTVTLTGDVTGTGTGSFAATIPSGTITLAKQANLAANSIQGNNTGSPAAPLALTTAQAKTLLAIANTDVSGLGTASTAATGTSGHTLPFLDGANTFSAAQVVSGTLTISDGVSGLLRVGRFGGSGTSLIVPTSVSTGLEFRGPDNTAKLTLDNTNATFVTTVLSSTSILSSGATAGVGYSTGAGGAVTQLTSRTTGVTLNKVCGAITIFSAAGAATYNTFTVTDSAVAATDTIVVVQKSGTNLYIPLVTAVAAGSFGLSFATTGGTATDAPVFNFCILKGVAA